MFKLSLKQRDEEKCAEVFADFVASFEDSRAQGKTFVRGSIINPETKGIFITVSMILYRGCIKVLL